ncbi:MAG: hypothetical protein JJ909_08355, partial [Roseivirga sp.]|nr:hypothetical protein [Roseivirga sp.]
TEGRSVSFLPNYKLNSTLSYEYNSESFSFIDRLRYIEFDRDWSYNPEDFNQSFTENILNAGFDLSKDASNNFSYKLVRRKRGEAVDGFQQYLNLSKR